MGELLDVVHKAEELPLRIDFGFSSQGEAIEPLVVSDVAEHRLHRREASSVEHLARGRIDAFLHSVGVTLRRGRGLALEERHLPRLGLLGGA